MKYTQIPTDTFSHLQLNAGILVKNFDPTTGEATNLIGATTGGVNFKDAVEYTDFGDDIDNCPKNMKELKVLDSHEVTMSGTFVSVSSATAKLLAAAADVSGNKITPRNDIVDADFEDIWWVGDYSDTNTGADAGFIAIRLINALNTGGFQIQTTDRGKGQFAFEFTGHYSMDAQDTVPYELYVKGGSEQSPFIYLNAHSASIGVSETYQLNATTYPEGATVTYSSSATGKATVSSDGLVTGVAAGNAIITAAITDSGVTYNDTCTIIVTA